LRLKPSETKLEDQRFRSDAISANWARAAWRSSTISAAMVSGVAEIGAVFEAFIFEPEDVEVEFVALG